jgi:hypothetical protein
MCAAILGGVRGGDGVCGGGGIKTGAEIEVVIDRGGKAKA